MSFSPLLEADSLISHGVTSLENGVLIHLSRMNAVSYDATTDLITLEPGVSWGEAIAVLEPQGVALMGGRVRFVFPMFPGYKSADLDSNGV